MKGGKVADQIDALRAVPELAPWVDALAPLIRMQIALTPRAVRKTDPISRASRLGGIPDLPPDQEWPRLADGSPMIFIGQLDLAEVAAVGIESDLPRAGLLSFFAQWTTDDWRGRVLHCEGTCRPAAFPNGLEPIRASHVRALELSPRVVLPPFSSRLVALDDERGRPVRMN